MGLLERRLRALHLPVVVQQVGLAGAVEAVAGVEAPRLDDMQRGNRNGAWTPLMASAVAHLGAEDLLTAAAYLASLKP